MRGQTSGSYIWRVVAGAMTLRLATIEVSHISAHPRAGLRQLHYLAFSPTTPLLILISTTGTLSLWHTVMEPPLLAMCKSILHDVNIISCAVSVAVLASCILLATFVLGMPCLPIPL